VLVWALEGLDKEITATRARLSTLTAQAAQIRARVRRGGSVATSAPANGRRPRRRARMTAEGRKRISEMMKKRWKEAKKKNQNRLS
jgi:hypothetical protein